MGIDQLKFQSVQLGYLMILQMGNTDPNNIKSGKRIRGPSAITARWYSDTTNQSITTPMIALDLSRMTHLSAGHNVALSQILLKHGKFNLLNWFLAGLNNYNGYYLKSPEEPKNAQETQVIQLVVVLTQLVVPREVASVSQSHIAYKFDKGCHFSPLIAKDHEEKLQHILDDLSPTIQRDVQMADPTGYDAALNRVFKSEQMLKEYTGRGTKEESIPASTIAAAADQDAFYWTTETTRPRVIVLGVATRALFYSGATNSFILEKFVRRMGIVRESLTEHLLMMIPSGEELHTASIVQNLEMVLQGCTVFAYLIDISMPEFDIILGIDLLSRYQTVIDFQDRMMVPEIGSLSK
ncbi:hypothetical protein F511_34310 [Dorcoceras hygrometricum]|uniref:Uncharacterized protein n=1 Tax=Dorcoceras hygrometricum TaxID=472368 RepID=A0A2Z7CZS6_9LAMI|nr:hypothetical protein F511_34310 [Dorcoceras hygrometricum]